MSRRPDGRAVHWSVLLAAAALPFLAGIAAGGCIARPPGPEPAVPGRDPQGEPRDSAPSHQPDDLVPTGEAPGAIPIGWPRTEAGARGAGVAVAGAYQAWLYLTDDALAESISAVATAYAAPRLIEELTGEVRLVRDALAATAGQVWWVVRPLAVRVASFSSARATVAVWVVSVLSAADVAVPQSAWATVTVEFAWVGGAWRVDGLSRRPGPTPVLDASDQPWPPEALASALEGFELLGVGT